VVGGTASQQLGAGNRTISKSRAADDGKQVRRTTRRRVNAHMCQRASSSVFNRARLLDCFRHLVRIDFTSCDVDQLVH